MPYTAPYTRRKTWADFPTTTTPILAADLNAFEDFMVAGMIGDEAQGGTVGAPTSRTVWKFQPKDTNKGPFQMVIGGTTFNTTWDTVMYLGYNVADGGGRSLTSEPAFYWAVEQDYNDGTKHNIESYFEFVSSDGTFLRRPIFFQFNRSTNALENSVIRVNNLQLTDWTTSTETVFASWNKNSLSLKGWTALDTTLELLAPSAGQGTHLSMQYGNTYTFAIDTISTTETALTHGGATMRMFSSGTGRISVFAEDNSTARFSILGESAAIPTFAVKADAAQSDSLISALSSAGVKLTHLNKSGYFMTRLHAAPADADVATGEVALWFDQTIGATKLMVKGKDSGGTVRTATIAMA